MTGSVKDAIGFAFFNHRADLTSDESRILTSAVTRFESVEHSDLHTLQCNLFLTSGVIL